MPHPYRLALLISAALLLAGCGQKEDKKTATQAAVRVNGSEITVHQINQVLSRVQGLTEENAPQARQEVLNRLVDQQLAIDQAYAKKLDRQPEIMAAIEAARREVLAKAYLDHFVSAQPKPAAEEAKKYYNDHPELFAQRRIYNLQEIALEKNEAILPDLREKLAAAKSFEEVAQWLKEKGAKFSVKGGVRPAEQIPLEMLAILHPMRDGQATVISGPQGTVIVRIAGAQTAPVDEVAAMPRIQQFLANQRAKDTIEGEIKQLREKAKIEYLGDFAAAANARAAAPAAAAPAPANPGLGNVEKAVGALK